MEASKKKYFTFGEALKIIQGSPDNYGMSREKYLNKGYFIVETLPTLPPIQDLDGDFILTPTLYKVDFNDSEFPITKWLPTNEDLHVNNWVIVRPEVEVAPKKVAKTEIHKTDSMSKEECLELIYEIIKRIECLPNE